MAFPLAGNATDCRWPIQVAVPSDQRLARVGRRGAGPRVCLQKREKANMEIPKLTHPWGSPFATISILQSGMTKRIDLSCKVMLPLPNSAQVAAASCPCRMPGHATARTKDPLLGKREKITPSPKAVCTRWPTASTKHALHSVDFRAQSAPSFLAVD